MSYVDRNLLPGETVILRGRLHWIVYGRSIGLLIFGGLLMVPWSPDRALSKLWIFGAAAILVALISALPALFEVMSTELVITSRRIVAKKGMIRRQSFEMLHRKVESISVQQSFGGRLLGYGTVLIHGTGGGIETIPRIAAPLVFRNAAMAQADAGNQT